MFLSAAAVTTTHSEFHIHLDALGCSRNRLNIFGKISRPFWSKRALEVLKYFIIGSPDKGVHLQGGQDNFYVAWVFALKLKLSKTLRGPVYFVPYLYGGRSPPPITAIQNTQAPSEFLTTSISKQKAQLLLIWQKIKSD